MNIPSEYICPISQDLMTNPVKVVHDGFPYFFDKVYLDTYKKTPNADKNPLTMVQGFSSVIAVPAIELKNNIDKFKKDNGIVDDPVVPTLEPFSDYDQIQEDERMAIDMQREIINEYNQSALINELNQFMNNIINNHVAFGIFVDEQEALEETIEEGH